MAGQVATRASMDALEQDQYGGTSSPKKAKAKKKAKGKKGSKPGPIKTAKKFGRDFRGIKNGVPDKGPGPIAKAMGAPC